jgi:hypothetical protein
LDLIFLTEQIFYRLEADPDRRWLSPDEFERRTGYRDPEYVPAQHIPHPIDQRG